jgi:hypothetical protein
MFGSVVAIYAIASIAVNLRSKAFAVAYCWVKYVSVVTHSFKHLEFLQWHCFFLGLEATSLLPLGLLEFYQTASHQFAGTLENAPSKFLEYSVFF